MRWRLLQLADSGFPAGGFAHSGGLEAATLLADADPEAVAVATAWQTGTFSFPFVRESHRDPARLGELDALYEVSQANEVARRASRIQGRALLRAAAGAFSIELPTVAHLPVAFGALTSRLAIDEREALGLFLYISVRGVLSAAVRLGRLGPTEAQRVQETLPLQEVLDCCCERDLEDAAHSAPVVEIYASLHDTLAARLFQS